MDLLGAPERFLLNWWYDLLSVLENTFTHSEFIEFAFVSSVQTQEFLKLFQSHCHKTI